MSAPRNMHSGGCRIRNWSKHFENSRSREIKSIDWVPIPNKMDGDGYTQLVDHPNAAAHLGAWLALVEIASRREERGTLPYSGSQLARYLSRISRLPAEVFEEVLPRLEEIGWIEVIQQDTKIPQGADTLPPQAIGEPSGSRQDAAPRVRAQKRTEEKGIEENRTESRWRETATGTQPTETDWRTPDLQVIAHALATELHERHPTLGSLEMAKSAMVREIAKAKPLDPLRWAEGLRTTHRTHCVIWADHRGRDPNAFVPMLHRWVSEGTYLQRNVGAPPRAAPKNQGLAFLKSVQEGGKLA